MSVVAGKRGGRAVACKLQIALVRRGGRGERYNTQRYMYVRYCARVRDITIGVLFRKLTCDVERERPWK